MSATRVSGDLRISGDILVPNESASRATEVDATGKLKSSATTSTELGYVSGVTSAIQTQLGSKASITQVNVAPTGALFVAKNGLDTNTGGELNPFLTISAAIAAATSGTTIFIMPGSYVENITLVAGVSLQGQQARTVVITGNMTAAFAGTVYLHSLDLQASSGVVLTQSGSSSTNLQMHDCHIDSLSGASHGISYTNTNSASKLDFETGAINVVVSTSAKCFSSSGTAAGSVIFNYISSRLLDNKDNICLTVAGALAFSYSLDDVHGQIVVANTASFTGINLSCETTSAAIFTTNSSSISSMANIAALSGANPCFAGAGLFAHGLIGFPSTGEGFAATLNAGAGAAPIPTSSFQIHPEANTTAPYDGQVNYTGTHLYVTIGATRYQLDQQVTGTNTGDQTALTVPNTPSGNLVATNVQAALNELQSDIDNRALDSAVIKKDGSVTYTANQPMGNNKITGLLAGSASNDAVNKAQLDGVAAGALWLNPIIDPNLVDDSLSAPPGSPAIGDTYIVAATATGAFAGLEGRALMYDGSVYVDLLGRAVVAGDRFGVSMESATVGAGGLASKNDQIAQVVVATPGAITYTFTVPAISNAVYINNANSYHTGHQYDYQSGGWVEFGGLNAVAAGIGLSYAGNVLSINMGAGIVQLPSDEVGVDVHTSGGLMTTVDNSASSTVTAAQLAIKLDGATLAKSSSGLKLTDTAVTPNPYGSASAVPTFTVNAQGRLSAAADVNISIPSTQVSDFNEAAQDAVGNNVLDTASVNLTYNDGSGQISADVLPAGVDHDSLNNFVANKHIDHTAVVLSGAANGGIASTIGDISASRSISVDITNATAETSADNADLMLIYDNSATALRKMTRANFLAGIGGASAGDINETSFAGANNVAAPANVTGLAFANGVVRSFDALVSVVIDAATDSFEMFKLVGIQKAAGWDMAVTGTGDNSLVSFTIDSAGQVKYVSPNSGSFVSLTIRFRATTTSV